MNDHKAGRSLNILEDTVAAKNRTTPLYDYFQERIFTMKEKMLMILLEAGFTTKEINTAFGHSDVCTKACLFHLRRKVRDLLPDQVRPTVRNSTEEFNIKLNEKLRSAPRVSLPLVDLNISLDTL